MSDYKKLVYMYLSTGANNAYTLDVVNLRLKNNLHGNILTKIEALK